MTCSILKIPVSDVPHLHFWWVLGSWLLQAFQVRVPIHLLKSCGLNNVSGFWKIDIYWIYFWMAFWNFSNTVFKWCRWSSYVSENTNTLFKYIKAKLFKQVNTVGIRYWNVLTAVAKPKRYYTPLVLTISSDKCCFLLSFFCKTNMVVTWM